MALVLAVLPLLVSSETVRARIVAEAQAITGREISFRDAPRITFSPFLGIEIGSVIFEDPHAGPSDPPLLQMDRLLGQLKIWPALFGQARITRYQFVRPRFNFRVYESGKVSWAFPEGQMWGVLEQLRAIRQASATGVTPDFSAIPAVPVGDFEIVDGTAVYENRNTGSRETITNLSARFVWETSRSSSTLSANGIWRGEAFKVSARSRQPLMLLSGASTPVEIDLSSNALKFGFRGEANLLADLHLRGRTSVEAPSVRRVLGLFGNEVAQGSTLSGFSVTGQMVASPNQFNFTDADVTLDGNRGKGALQISYRGRDMPKVNGTLACDSLDLTPYFAAFRQDAGTGRSNLGGLRLSDSLEFDLRISAARAILPWLTARDLAAAISIRPQESLIDIGNASVFGGTLAGSIATRFKQAEATIEAKGMLSGFDAAQASELFSGSPLKYAGKGDAQIAFKSHGARPEDVPANLRGSARLKLSDGAITGIDFAEMHAVSLAPNGTRDLKLGGQTAFKELNANLDLFRKTVLVRNFRLSSAKGIADVSGKADLRSRGIAMRIGLGPPPESTAPGAPYSMDALVFVGGSIDAPLFTRNPGYPQDDEYDWALQ